MSPKAALTGMAAKPIWWDSGVCEDLKAPRNLSSRLNTEEVTQELGSSPSVVV